MTTSADQYHEIHRAGSSDGHAITHREFPAAAPSCSAHTRGHSRSMRRVRDHAPCRSPGSLLPDTGVATPIPAGCSETTTRNISGRSRRTLRHEKLWRTPQLLSFLYFGDLHLVAVA